MKITVAGEDRSGDLGRMLVEEAARLKAAGSAGALAPGHSALSLKESADRDDFLRRFIGLLRLRHGVRTADYYIPRAPGLRGKAAVALKTVLWKLLRYQHDRISSQQNLVNELAIGALEFQQDRMDRELADLKKRIGGLEKKGSEGAA